jgi:hypothetical protein
VSVRPVTQQCYGVTEKGVKSQDGQIGKIRHNILFFYCEKKYSKYKKGLGSAHPAIIFSLLKGYSLTSSDVVVYYVCSSGPIVMRLDVRL